MKHVAETFRLPVHTENRAVAESAADEGELKGVVWVGRAGFVGVEAVEGRRNEIFPADKRVWALRHDVDFERDGGAR